MDIEPDSRSSRVAGDGSEGGLHSVNPLDLVETIRLVSTQGRTGTLTVAGPDGQERQMYFQDGLIKMIANPTPDSDSLEQALLGSRSFSRAEVDAAREEARGSGKSLAQVLLEQGASRGMDAGRLLDLVTCREAASLLAWGQLKCSFQDGAPAVQPAEPYASRLGGIDAEEILDALRQAARDDD